MTVAILSQYSRDTALDILGVVAPRPGDPVPPDCQSVILLGPHEPGFWAEFSASPEYQDGGPDPLDRWSKRVIGTLAQKLGGTALFPSDGPPYPPFFRWAQQSGRSWQSPVTLLVHDTVGLWVSFRGAIVLSATVVLEEPLQMPCRGCDKPCQTACPVNALTSDGYDLVRCHSYLDTPDGQDCMIKGCAVRRACPVSQRYGRVEAQSAFHMKSFHPE